jgi:alkylation response protein AidB-like acyl-CoA dehydrogenase
MRVDLSDEQEFLREAVSGVLAREATTSRVREWADARDSTAADVLATRQGWTGIGLAEERGGQGGGIVELAIVAEELGRTAAPWDRLLGSALALQLLGASDDGAAAELAGAVAEGERAVVLCADGRRIPAPWPETVLDGDRLTLTAEYVPGAVGAELVVAVSHGDAVRLLAVHGDDIEVAARPLVDRTRALARVELDGTSPRELGTASVEAYERMAGAAAVLVAADALGAAARLLEMTVEYVKDRRQFGVPVGTFQAVKHAAAMMLVEVEGARSAVRYGAWAVDSDAEGARSWASIAKVGSCGAAPHVADRALFLHGAIGYTWEHDLQFCFKRTKSDEWLFGSPDAHRDRIAGGLELTRDPIPAE